MDHRRLAMNHERTEEQVTGQDEAILPTKVSQPQSATIFAAVALPILMTLALATMGRRWWCACNGWSLTSWDIWSSHNSQHFVDPYFFSHVLHGVLFFWFLSLFSRKLSFSTRVVFAITLEVGWELLENSPLIINRYREATMALNYIGDSIANSWFDVVACTLGFLIAARMKWWGAVLFFCVVEIAMVMAIRDCLTLNVLMLAWPIEAIKLWQSPI
jgi:Protein of unknown function (DUF2585)